MCITEFNEKSFVDGIKEDGVQEAKIKMTINMHNKGISIEQIAQIAEADVNTVKKWIENNKMFS